jgi:hypothetical protein
MWNVTLVTDGNLTFHLNIRARNPSAAWEAAVRQAERETRFEIDSGNVRRATA